MSFYHRVSPVQIIYLKSEVEVAMNTANACAITEYYLVGPLIRPSKPGKDDTDQGCVQNQGYDSLKPYNSHQRVAVVVKIRVGDPIFNESVASRRRCDHAKRERRQEVSVSSLSRIQRTTYSADIRQLNIMHTAQAIRRLYTKSEIQSLSQTGQHDSSRRALMKTQFPSDFQYFVNPRQLY